jgi:hypothetical protein
MSLLFIHYYYLWYQHLIKIYSLVKLLIT